MTDQTTPTESFDTRLKRIFRQLNASNSIVKDTSHLYDDNQLLRAFEKNEERAQQAIRELVLSELISEWHSIGNWNSDKGIAELWPVIEKRLAELNGGKDE